MTGLQFSVDQIGGTQHDGGAKMIGSVRSLVGTTPSACDRRFLRESLEDLR
jgi:hypothetical protein